MKNLDEYDDVEDAIRDWLKYVDNEDYKKKWPDMAEQFKRIDTFRVAEVILCCYGFKERADSGRMKTFLASNEYNIHAIMPNTPVRVPIFNSNTLELITGAELAGSLTSGQFMVFSKYKEYFDINWGSV